MDPLDIRYCPGAFGSKHLGHTFNALDASRCVHCGEPSITSRLDMDQIARDYRPLKNLEYRAHLARRYRIGKAFLPVRRPAHLLTAPFKRYVLEDKIRIAWNRPSVGI